MKFVFALLALSLLAPTGYADSGERYAQRAGQKRLELALALTEAFDAGAVCEAEAYPATIVSTIKTARYQVKESVFRGFLARVSKKSELQRNFAFREATGKVNLRADMSEADLRKALLGTVFYHFGQGAYGSTYNVTLAANGVANERILELIDENPGYRWTTRSSTWSLVRNENAPLVGHFLRVGEVEFRLEYAGDGDFQWVPTDVKEGDTDYQRTLSTSASYCDA